MGGGGGLRKNVCSTTQDKFRCILGVCPNHETMIQLSFNIISEGLIFCSVLLLIQHGGNIYGPCVVTFVWKS